MGTLDTSNLLLPILLALPGLFVWLGTQARRDRSRIRQMKIDIDEHEKWAIQSRRTRRLHNDEWHPRGEGGIDIPDLPSSMTREEDYDA